MTSLDGRAAAVTRRLWLTAGWLMIACVVVTFGGAVFQSQVTTGAKPSAVTSALVTSSMAKAFTGGYLELLATLIFLVAALLLAQLLRGHGELGGWLASCMSGAAVAYTAVTIATGLAAGAAALYEGHHGAALTTVTTVNDIRGFGFALSGGVAGLFVLAASAAGQSSRALPRGLAYAGYAIGLVCIAGVPAVRAGAPQTLLWYAWLVVVGVIALRRARRGASVVVSSPAAVSV